MRSFIVIDRLIREAMRDDHKSTTYFPRISSHRFLARFCLLLLCKSLQNQVVLVRFSALACIEGFHKFPVGSNGAFDERVRWLAKFAKQADQLALEGVANSLAITSLIYLKEAVNEDSCSHCLKAIAYFYMMGFCTEERYNVEDIELVTEHLRRAVQDKKVRPRYYHGQ